jgi:hypothetical protein
MARKKIAPPRKKAAKRAVDRTAEIQRAAARAGIEPRPRDAIDEAIDMMPPEVVRNVLRAHRRAEAERAETEQSTPPAPAQSEQTAAYSSPLTPAERRDLIVRELEALCGRLDDVRDYMMDSRLGLPDETESEALDALLELHRVRFLLGSQIEAVRGLEVAS